MARTFPTVCIIHSLTATAGEMERAYICAPRHAHAYLCLICEAVILVLLAHTSSSPHLTLIPPRLVPIWCLEHKHPRVPYRVLEQERSRCPRPRPRRTRRPRLLHPRPIPALVTSHICTRSGWLEATPCTRRLMTRRLNCRGKARRSSFMEPLTTRFTPA